jgi:hypothetical protein
MKPALLLLAACISVQAGEPIRLHPDNPHYFLFRGKPTILITSGEHYGAVLNLDFNYVKYLNTLAGDKLNLTRTFSGAYREVPGSFQIADNTLAPPPERFICPWQRSETPGAADGLNKFDLLKWNPAYFTRLHDFVAEASKRGVVVELNLFCPMYEDSLWDVNPLNIRNNVNGIGDVKRTEVLTLKDSRLVLIQDVLVRKLVAELRDFDNVYYEIANEPYFGGVTLEWQRHISDVVREAEPGFMISQNIANGSRKIEDPDPTVSLFNFHYSRPPDAVAMNYALNKAIGMNETGFDGQADAIYRIQGWDFLIAGGALYNNLDYSFTVGREDGTFEYPAVQPGGGSRVLRRQLRHLREFLENFDFLRMAPHPEVIAGGVPGGASARVLAQPGKAYAIYLHHGREVKDAKPKYQVDGSKRNCVLFVNLPAGSYEVGWFNPARGRYEKRESFKHEGGQAKLASPFYVEDLAIRIELR